MLTSLAERKYSRLNIILTNIFYLLFCAQILSPSTGAVSLYLEIFVAVANPYFWDWTKKYFTNKNIILGLTTFIICTAAENYILLFKFFAFTISIAYIQFTRANNCFYLFRYVQASVIVAILQFGAIFIDDALAYNLGPTSIAKFFWGEYATGTFTNFYTIFAFERVSGLSREGGFFATFILNSILIYWLDKYKYPHKNITVILLLIIGFILSFSKMSFLLPVAIIILKYRRLLNLIPFYLVPTIFTVGLMLLWSGQFDFFDDELHGTYLQRFGGYIALSDLSFKQLLFGIDKLQELDSNVARLALASSWDNFDYFSGFPGYIFKNGIIFTGLTTILFWCLGMSSAGFLLLLVLTVNVDIATNQNFVTLTYFILYALIPRKKRSSRAPPRISASAV